jgi:hypothetical protein
MTEAYHEVLSELENDGWQTLDWHDWRLAVKDKTLGQYMEKQADEAVRWYCKKNGVTIPGYERGKKDSEYDKETLNMINGVIFEYLSHVDEVTGLKGSENFARRNLMYREDAGDVIVKRYTAWEETDKLHEEALAAAHALK